jgi:hypothetical protein
MKQLIITIIFIFAYSLIFSQSFKISELVKIIDYPQDELDTYLNQKGFKYYETINDGYSEGIVYVFYSNGGRYAYLTKQHLKFIDKILISFQTPSNSEYLKIKSELKTLGYKYVNSTNSETSICLKYVKGNIELSLHSIPEDNQTIYEISVAR